jgi:hypothetical protein
MRSAISLACDPSEVRHKRLASKMLNGFFMAVL